MAQCVAPSLTLFGSETDVVYLMNMPQHKWFGVDNMTIRPDGNIIRLTADNMNVSFIAVCYCKENNLITPCAILLHVCKIISP